MHIDTYNGILEFFIFCHIFYIVNFKTSLKSENKKLKTFAILF